MESPRNLIELSFNEQISFVNSFDTVLCDLDGVLWTNHKTIVGAPECISRLKKLGKRVKYVTNNSMNSVEYIREHLKRNGVNANCDDISNPQIAAMDYLKKIKFEKTLYVLATEAYKNEMKKAGFKISADMPQIIEESLSKMVPLLEDDENVGAVIVDIDVNLTYIKLQKALTFLKRKDCLFIVGGGDKSLAMGSVGPVIGYYYFQELLKDISGRDYYRVSKPSLEYSKYINEIFNINQPERTLFIGDSINQDMGFATVAGYQKLLTLSGNTKMEDLNDWKHPNEYRPKYFIESLDSLQSILRKIN